LRQPKPDLSAPTIQFLFRRWLPGRFIVKFGMKRF